MQCGSLKRSRPPRKWSVGLARPRDPGFHREVQNSKGNIKSENHVNKKNLRKRPRRVKVNKILNSNQSDLSQESPVVRQVIDSVSRIKTLYAYVYTFKRSADYYNDIIMGAADQHYDEDSLDFSAQSFIEEAFQGKPVILASLPDAGDFCVKEKTFSFDFLFMEVQSCYFGEYIVFAEDQSFMCIFDSQIYSIIFRTARSFSDSVFKDHKRDEFVRMFHSDFYDLVPHEDEAFNIFQNVIVPSLDDYTFPSKVWSSGNGSHA